MCWKTDFGRSGLNLPIAGTQVLRHSFATRLMQQGVSIKAIGDTLGHRDIESTSVYLRLDVDELRQVALPVPATPPGPPVKLVAVNALPQIRPARACHHLPTRFQSRFAPSLQALCGSQTSLGPSSMLLRLRSCATGTTLSVAAIRALVRSVPRCSPGWTKTLVTSHLDRQSFFSPDRAQLSFIPCPEPSQTLSFPIV